MTRSGSGRSVALAGASGRMGQAVVRVLDAAQVPWFALSRDVSAAALAGRDDVRVVVDFSRPEHSVRIADACAGAGIPAVICTTGLSDSDRAAIASAASRVAIVVAANTSVGVALLADAVERVTSRVAALGLRFDVEISETHHAAKVDAPSGTALMLRDAVLRGQAARPEMASHRGDVHGRHGHVGARPEGEVGIHALRGGDVIGDHTVFLFGSGERIELTHKATDRSLFARGAWTAAQWVQSQQPGLYGMRDVLGLNPL